MAAETKFMQLVLSHYPCSWWRAKVRRYRTWEKTKRSVRGESRRDGAAWLARRLGIFPWWNFSSTKELVTLVDKEMKRRRIR